MYSIYWKVILLIGLVESRGTFFKVSKEFGDEAIKGSIMCSDKFGLPVDMLEKFLASKFEDTPPVRKYIHCLGVTLDVCQENGILKHSLSKYAGNDKRKSDVIKTVDECNKVEASDKYERAYKASICYLNNSPLLFTL